MYRQQYLPGNLEGPDVDIETSLKEYGIAWNTGTNGDAMEILFYYGTQVNDDGDYIRFDFCSLSVDTRIRVEYNWANFDGVSSYIGQDIHELNFVDQIQALVSYYGFENIFGSTYWEGLTYQDIMMNW